MWDKAFRLTYKLRFSKKDSLQIHKYNVERPLELR